VGNDPSIYVPPDAQGDPFKAARTRSRSPLRLAALGGGVLALAAIGGALVLRGGGGFEGTPGPLVEALSGTDWRSSADPVTGYRLLGGPFSTEATVDRVAIGRDGTMAIALRRGATSWVILWRGGRFLSRGIPEAYGTTGLAVDPEGTVYVGFPNGSFARVSPSGEVAREGAVSGGYSVIGFAFDVDSNRSALMTAGGGVHTAMRPLRVGSLHAVDMPPRARIRSFGYSSDGELVVGGDAGALFVATADGWEDRTLPTSGQVTAIGLDGPGDVMVAQANGHVFRASGSTWKRIGQVTSSPVAVGETPEHEYVVVSADGRLWATLGRDDFSEMPGRETPASMAVTSAAVMGHDVVLSAGDRAQVFDGRLWDSTDATVVSPGDTVAMPCERIGAGLVPTDAAPVLLFECGVGRFARITGGELHAVEDVDFAGQRVRAADLARAIGEAEDRAGTWVRGELWAPTREGSLPAIERWDPAEGQWDLVAPLVLEEGPALAISAVSSAEMTEVWTLSRSDAVRMARIGPDASAPVFELVTTHERFQAHYGDSFFPWSASIEALGSGRALVVHDRHRLTRVAMGNDDVEPLELFEDPDSTVAAVGRCASTALLVSGESAVEVSALSPPRPWALPAGIHPAAGALPGILPVHCAGATMIVRGSTEEGAALLRCEDGRCERVPLPPWAAPVGLGSTEDGRLVVEEPRGAIAILEPRGGR